MREGVGVELLEGVGDRVCNPEEEVVSGMRKSPFFLNSTADFSRIFAGMVVRIDVILSSNKSSDDLTGVAG